MNKYIERQLNLDNILSKKSLFLLGPRQTGKSSLIKHTLKNAIVYDLLDSSVFLELSQNPDRLSQQIISNKKVVVIDEIQRLPVLLNEVPRLIEEKGAKFLLTGSSARKLRRGGVNLLGGRARTKHFFPFTFYELKEQFDLTRALFSGLIPSIYFSDDVDADLAAYNGSYLQQEIIAESATRNIQAFSRFLKIAALCNAKIVNFTNVASDAQVPRTTIYEYFDILKDTLIMRELPSFRKGNKRKPICSSKYYFFDVGVIRQLQGRSNFSHGTPEFGEIFETFIINELFACSEYKKNLSLEFWRSTSGFEVDLIINEETAVEIKGKTNISASDLKSLKALAEEYKLRRLVCVSLEKRPRKIGNIEILPYKDFLMDCWK
ncbi:MAG: ATP-binding protein [Candidatus Omnitrophica bacterium]|nr:ATP-binding protein [Candidatus Omnitrophota bacterium]